MRDVFRESTPRLPLSHDGSSDAAIVPPAIAEYVARQHRIQRNIRFSVIAIVGFIVGAKITYAHLHQHDWTCAFITCAKATP